MPSLTLELLAPAGSIDSFYAALDAGADAVYLGLDAFNARLRAKNFSVKVLSGLVPYAHSRGRKVYVTLNTIVKQSELERLIHVLYQLEQVKPDGLIVADLGLIELARSHFPGLALHASTQMVVHNSDGVLAAAEMGLKRVILARELTFEEIRAIAANSPVELEVFVHGALCYSVSGLCLASSFLGGASGNRGRCTQVCRRPFQGAKEKGFYFSTKDLCALAFVPRYREIGIASLKIEGRMKNAEYVRFVVSAYRRAIDGTDADADLRHELEFDMGREKSTFFLSGLRQEGIINETQFGGTGKYLGAICRLEGTAIAIDTAEPVCVGDQLRIHPVSGFEGIRAKVTSVDTVHGARVLGLSDLAGITVGAGVYLTATKSLKTDLRPPSQKIRPIPLRIKYPSVSRILAQFARSTIKAPSARNPQLVVKIDTFDWLPILGNPRIDAVVTQFSLDHAMALADARPLLDRWKGRLILGFPPFIPECDLSAWRRVAQRLRSAGVRRWMCSHPSQMRLCHRNDVTVADTTIWCLNRATQKALQAQGFKQFSYSVEDDFPNVRATNSLQGIAYQFGRIALFVSRIRSGIKPETIVTDARNKAFISAERHGLFYLVSSEPLCLFHQRRRLEECGISTFMVDFSFYLPDPVFARTVIEHFYSRTRFTPSTLFNFKTSLQ